MAESTKRKILIFSTAYYPYVGGAEIAIKEITDRLAMDYEFDLITARFSPTLKSVEKVGNVNVYRIGTGNKLLDKIFLPIRGAIFALKLNRVNKYYCYWAVMVSFSSGAAYLANILGSLVGLKKVPIVLNLQEGDSESHLKYRWFGLISLSWRLALKETKVLTALSNFLLDRAKKYGYNGKSFLVPNGVSVNIFSREISDIEKNNLKRKFDKKEGDIYLITTSRLNYKNATDDIISSLKYLPENVQLLILGIGEDGPKLQEMSRKMDLVKRVKFVGFVDHKDIPKYLAISDVFVRPSRSEGFGNSFIEAMAAGIPVIATPVGGIVDFLDDKETGLFCSPDNPKSIADAVIFILNNNEDKNRIISKAKERAISQYNWDKIARDMKKLVFENIYTS